MFHFVLGFFLHPSYISRRLGLNVFFLFSCVSLSVGSILGENIWYCPLVSSDWCSWCQGCKQTFPSYTLKEKQVSTWCTAKKIGIFLWHPMHVFVWTRKQLNWRIWTILKIIIENVFTAWRHIKLYFVLVLAIETNLPSSASSLWWLLAKRS